MDQDHEYTNQAKERKLGSKAKLRDYFVTHVGEILDSDSLRQIAGTSEWARRIRELRNEEGLDILSHNDLESLKPGQYVLRSTTPKPSFERAISKETRALVLDRNGSTCRMCGAVAGDPHPYDVGRTTRLHIGHILDKSLGGTDDPDNLQALCSVCNEGAANITLQRPDASKLLVQIRRSPRGDQQEVLAWLVRKFPDQAKKLLAESNE